MALERFPVGVSMAHSLDHVIAPFAPGIFKLGFLLN
jgi:hypothetical protein